MMLFISQLLNGINSAAMLLITSLGVVIIMGYMRVVNLAHGESIMLGAFVSYYVTTIFQLPYICALLFAFILTACFGILIERLIIRRLYGKEGETLLVTYGLSLILQQGIKILCGSDLKYIQNPFGGQIYLGSIVIPKYNIFILVMAIIILGITGLLLFKTRFGIKLQAISGNRTMSECLGINTAMVDTVTFAYGVGLAGLAGAIVAPMKGVSPFMGTQFLTDAFINVVVGGLNSLVGIGLSSALIGETTNLLSGMINEVNASILVFLVVIILIRFKPEGLFSKERR